jgi:hypothetical protein
MGTNPTTPDENLPPRTQRDHMHERQRIRKQTSFALRLMGELGAWISTPIIVLSWIGRQVDVLLGTKPKLLALSFLLAFVVSTVGLCLRALDFGEEYEQLTDGPPRETGDPGGPGIRGGPPGIGRVS